MIKLFALVSIIVHSLYAIDMYPWGSSKDYLDRSQKILDLLKRNLGLDVNIYSNYHYVLTSSKK